MNQRKLGAILYYGQIIIGTSVSLIYTPIMLRLYQLSLTCCG